MMKDFDQKLARLLRSAAQSQEETAASAPFGFDTRVVALWRAAGPNGTNGLGRFLRRVALTASTVIVIGSAAALYQFNQDREDDDSYGNEFAIADNAIQSEILP